MSSSCGLNDYACARRFPLLSKNLVGSKSHTVVGISINGTYESIDLIRNIAY